MTLVEKEETGVEVNAEEDEEGKKKVGAKKRPNHPVIEALGKNEFITELPVDFDFQTQRGIARKKWASDSAYFDYKAQDYEFRATKMRGFAENARTFGSKNEQAKAKRLIKMTDKVAELRAQLILQGVDVDSLLGASV